MQNEDEYGSGRYSSGNSIETPGVDGPAIPEVQVLHARKMDNIAETAAENAYRMQTNDDRNRNVFSK
jgi:hypothetical protein